jgi:hypothetical protein
MRVQDIKSKRFPRRDRSCYRPRGAQRQAMRQDGAALAGSSSFTLTDFFQLEPPTGAEPPSSQNPDNLSGDHSNVHPAFPHPPHRPRRAVRGRAVRDAAPRPGGFDLIYDYTFLCALDPRERARWAQTMRRLLKPGGGELITLIFPIGDYAGGPPHAMSQALVEGLLKQEGYRAPRAPAALPPGAAHGASAADAAHAARRQV